MSTFTTLGTSQLGAKPRCEACGAGATVWFNWAYAHKRQSQEDQARVAQFALWRHLRRGSLYRCGICQEVWHLDGNESKMTYVGTNRLELVLAWDKEPIVLSPETIVALDEIGPTPPDMYGNGIQYRLTPCAVETRSGELIDPAIVCIQLDAPVDAHRECRLGTDIARVRESPFTLPLEIRRATGRAEEMRMGFSPSLIEMPDARRFVLNGMTNFFVLPGSDYAARDAKAVAGSFFEENPRPAFAKEPDRIVYFIADGEPGWTLDALHAPASPAVKKSGWLQKLFGR